MRDKQIEEMAEAIFQNCNCGLSNLQNNLWKV